MTDRPRPEILVTAGTVVTMDPARRVIDDGAVLVRDGRIAAVGTRSEVVAGPPPATVIDAGAEAMVLPGFINTHTHLFQGLLKGLGDDRPLHRWLREMTAPAASALTEADCEAAALAGAVEAITSGVTTVVDFMYTHPRAQLTDAVIAGLDRAGIRAVVARGFVTQGTDLGIPPALVETADAALADAERLVRRYDGPDARVRVGIAPTLLWMVDEDALRSTRTFADATGALITYHLAETDFEVDFARRRLGMRETEFLASTGVLGPDLLAVHCTRLEPRDIQLLATFDVKVSHNPISNMYLAAGIAPVRSMLAAGLTVGLATDGPASNNNQNMLHVLKAAALLHKVADEDPTAMTAEEVLEMATIQGARAIGQDAEIGSIEVGKRADLVVMALDNAFVGPVHDPVSAIVYAALGNEARWVIVDGRVVLDSGRMTTLDEDAVRRGAVAAAHALASRSGIGSPSRTWRPRKP